MGRRIIRFLRTRLVIRFQIIKANDSTPPADPAEAAVYWRGIKQHAQLQLVDSLEQKKVAQRGK